MKKDVLKSNQPNKFNQPKLTSILDLAEAVNTPGLAKAFREALPEHPLSKPFRSKKQQRRYGKR